MARRRKDQRTLARHLATVLLIPASALVGHGIAYALSEGHAHTTPAHGHLPALASVAVPLALAGLAWHAGQGARGAQRPSLRLLLVVQPVVFVTQEGVEHVVSGHGVGSLVHSPVVRLGILAEFLVAVLAMLFVRAARATGQAIGAALRHRGQARGREDPHPRPAMAAVLCLSRMGMPTSERGPPDLLAHI